MRRKLAVEIGCSLFALLIAPSLASAARAQAAPAAGKKAATVSLEQALKSAHKLLAEADFDYQGHRAKAAAEVHKAMNELGYRHQHKVSEGKRPTGEKAIHEAQAKSDSQLREAQRLLQGIADRMSSHPKAAANVQAALSEIGTALSIK